MIEIACRNKNNVDKILAIKTVRNLTGVGLKTAKDLIDVAMDKGMVQTTEYQIQAKGSVLLTLQETLAGSGFELIRDNSIASLLNDALEVSIACHHYTIASKILEALAAAQNVGLTTKSR